MLLGSGILFEVSTAGLVTIPKLACQAARPSGVPSSLSKWSRYCVGVVTVTGLVLLAHRAGAETCTLKMKKIGLFIASIGLFTY
jgi:hypothetical protein